MSWNGKHLKWNAADKLWVVLVGMEPVAEVSNCLGSP
jgi:hypothetical protein